MKRIFSAIKLFSICILMLGIFTAISSGGESPGLIDFVIGFAVSASFIVLSATRKPNKRTGFVTNDFSEALCLLIQTSMNKVFGKNEPSQKRTQVGYLQAIRSPINRAGFEQQDLKDEEGKVHAIKIIGTTRGCEDDISDDCPDPDNDSCIGDTEVPPWEDIVTDFFCITSPAFKFRESQMRKICDFGTDDAYRARIINSYIDPMMVQLNKRMLTIQNANFGNFFDGSNASESVELLNANGTPNFFGEATLLELLEDVEVNQKPLVVGSDKLGLYVRQVGIGCCNDGGINLSQAGNMDFYRDKYVAGILGADQFIALQPGMVQLVTKNRYVGQYVRNHEHYQHNVFVDPYTGIPIDMKAIYDPCKEVYFMQFSFNWMMYFMSAKARRTCDELYNVNGSWKFLAAQGA